MSDDSLRTAGPEDPDELDAFPSEEQISADSAHTGPGPRTAENALTQDDAAAEIAPEVAAPVVTPAEPLVLPPMTPAVRRAEPDRVVLPFEGEPRVPAASHETAEPAAPVGKPATITEFPTQPARPLTPPTPPIEPNAITLTELLERQGGLDWRGAVAVVRQICNQLKDEESRAPILLEGRNILINHEGAVRLLPGKTGGDPLVIQIGRLLRAMLAGTEAPPELRLLLAQATFELPIFESVEDVERALAQLERIDVATNESSSFEPPLATNPAAVAPEPSFDRSPPRSILPAPLKYNRRRGRRPVLKAALNAVGSRIGVSIVVLGIVIGFLVARPALLFPRTTDGGRPLASPVVPPQPTVATSGTPDPAVTEPVADAGGGGRSPGTSPGVAPPAAAAAKATSSRATHSSEQPPLVSSPGARSYTATVTAVHSTPVDPAALRESQRRAAELMDQGQKEEAAKAFDALVQSSPLYEPRTTDLTPESLAAFRTSQRHWLPGIAQSRVERAQAALNAGDPDRALALAKEASAILDRPVMPPQSELRDQLRTLLDSVTAAQVAADSIIYSEGDPGIVPPQALSSQFPLKPPIEVPPHRVGTLEMIIDKRGGVSSIKLHTPLNRYHERMVVSAAKAWRYRPATKDGKPVNCRITVRINLPESGTDF
jgi:hypothetical protein